MEDGSRTSQPKRSLRDLAIGGGVFSLVMVLAFRYLALYDKSLVWVPDGAAQHFPTVYYWNQIVRDFLQNPAQGFPFWSWQLGFGADTINTLSFYAVGDPFVPLTLAFPMKSMELGFLVLYGVRLLCAGLFSAMYLRKMGARRFSALAGSLVYVFTAFTLLYSVHHPIFATALALFPLMLLGAEYALEGKRYWVLVLAVFLSAAGNFYFFYMEALTLILYVLARYFEITPKPERWRRLVPEGLRVGSSVLLGVLLAGPVLFPSIAAVFTTARRQVPFNPQILMTLQEYGHNIVALVSARGGANYAVLGFAPLVFVLIPALFVRRGNTALKAMLVAFPVFLSVPALGSVYNGFSFPSGRFSFEWALFIGLAVGLLLADERPFTRKQLAAMLGGYLVLWAAVFAIVGHVRVEFVVPFAIGLLSWGVFAVEAVRSTRAAAASPGQPAAEPDAQSASARGDWSEPLSRWLVLGLLVAGIFAAAAFTHDTRWGDNLQKNLPQGKVLNSYLKNPGALGMTVEDDSFFRTQASEPLFYNDAIVQGLNSTGFYYSIMNGNLTRFLVDNEVRPGWSSFSMEGLDDRAALNAVTAVKYYTTKPKLAMYTPYGYTPIKTTAKSILYRNEHALPLGFVYEGVLGKAEFDALPIVARQQAMLDAAVVDDPSALGLPSITPSITVVDVPCSVTATGAVVDMERNTIVRPVGLGRVHLTFAPQPDSELYVQIKDFENVASSPADWAPYLYPNGPTPEQAASLAEAERTFEPPRQMVTAYTAGGPHKEARWETDDSPYFWGDHTQLVNLGYSSSGVASATVTFRQAGKITFESMKVLAVPMAGYAEKVAALKANAMRDIKVTNNRVTGTVDSPKPGLLFLSIPYAPGWTATVDGKSAPLHRANTGFTGVVVPAGTHAIELRYATPWFAAGVASFGFALALSAGLLVLARRRARAGAGPAGPLA